MPRNERFVYTILDSDSRSVKELPLPLTGSPPASFVTRWLENGLEIRTVQDVLGRGNTGAILILPMSSIERAGEVRSPKADYADNVRSVCSGVTRNELL